MEIKMLFNPSIHIFATSYKCRKGELKLFLCVHNSIVLWGSEKCNFGIKVGETAF